MNQGMDSEHCWKATGLRLVLERSFNPTSVSRSQLFFYRERRALAFGKQILPSRASGLLHGTVMWVNVQ